jgi:ribosome biogenesis ATPase
LNAKQLDRLGITNTKTVLALNKMQPSSKTEGFRSMPDVTRADLGALQEAWACVDHRSAHSAPTIFARLGVDAPYGVLL